MTPNEKLDLLLEYLEAFELDLQDDYMQAMTSDRLSAENSILLKRLLTIPKII